MTKAAFTKTPSRKINIARTASKKAGPSAGKAKPAPKPSTTKSATKTVTKKTTARVPKNHALVLGSKLAFKGRVFNVYTEHVLEPNGVEATRDVVRHNGSVVVLAVDDTTNPSDPLVVIERQFRHAADQYLLELPAGRVEPGEKVLAAAKRELIEETGYRAKKWTKLVRYFASPGFVGEWMEIYLATGITLGIAEPEDDEKIEVRLVPLSQLVKMCAAGEINDGKTIVGAMLYAQQRAARG